jgi:hypothetical protein
MIVCRIELVRECCEMKKKEWQIVFKNKGSWYKITGFTQCHSHTGKGKNNSHKQLCGCDATNDVDPARRPLHSDLGTPLAVL